MNVRTSPHSSTLVSSIRFWLQGCTLDMIVTGVMVVLLFATGLCVDVQSDTWWLIRSGQYIVETGRVPTVDPFSSTATGAYWPNHEWLAEVVFYGLYNFGGMPLVATTMGVLLLAVWVALYRQCSGPGRVRAMVILLAFGLQAGHWNLRPYLFTLILLGVALALLPQKRWHWAYPVLFLLWANFHGGVAFGGVILVAACLVALIMDRKHVAHWATITATSATATLINPLGFGLWELVFKSLNNPVLNLAVEWLPPHTQGFYGYFFYALVLACAFVVARYRHLWQGHRDWTLIMCALVFALLGAHASRHAASFAMVLPFLLSRPFEGALPRRLPSPRSAVLHVAALVGIGMCAATLVHYRWTTKSLQPALSPTLVAAIRECEGKLFNTFYGGGFLLWAVPERLVFVDNRQDPYSPEFILSTVLVEQTGDYQRLFDDYDVSCAFVPSNSALEKALQRDNWVELGRDTKWTVLQQH